MDTYVIEPITIQSGNYMVVQISFVRSYTISGVLTDESQPISGVRVKAIGQKLGQRKFSVTNDARAYSWKSHYL
jgi:hypothetical protein